MENHFFNDETEKRLGEIVQKALRIKPSTPSRTACPDPKIIRDLAFHHKLDVDTVKKVVLHIAECFECAQLSEKYAGEYREERMKSELGDPAD